MIERLLIVALLLAVGFAAYRLMVWMQMRRVAARGPEDPIRQTLRPGVPGIVYFTTPGCIPCKTQQQPALRQLAEQVGDRVQIIQIDATEQPELASRWGVMTVPTTIILDASGRPGAVNHGVASANRLLQQLQPGPAP